MTALQRKMKRKAKEPRVVLLRPTDRIAIDAFGRRHILAQRDVTMNRQGPTQMTFESQPA